MRRRALPAPAPSTAPYRGLMGTVRRWLERHPVAWDVGGAVLTALLALPSTPERAPAAFLWGTGALWALVVATPLVWRRRAPVTVFVVVLPLEIAGSAAFGQVLPSAGLATLVALHVVASSARGPRLWAVVAAAELAAAAVAVALGGTEAPGGEVIGLWVLVPVLALPAAVAAVGVNRRVRRAHLASLEDRAQRLETEREHRDALAGAAERARIAREMHDVVAHSLTVIVSLAEGLAAGARARPDRAGDPVAMAALATTGREALTEMRTLLAVLGEDDAETAAPLRPQPGAGDLDALLAQVRAAGLPVTLTREGALLPELGAAGVGAAVHRIVQEALTNTLRHGGRRASATVLLACEGGRVLVEVMDSGGRTGPPEGPGGRGASADVRSGRGLRGMRERAEMLGGTVTAGPSGRGGWRVRADLPMPADAEGAALGRSALGRPAGAVPR